MMNKEILKKYLNNNCSDEEFEEFVLWVKSESMNKEGLQWWLNHGQRFIPEPQNIKEKKYEALLDNIHNEINAWQEENKNYKVVFSMVAKWLYRAAAIMFIPLLGVLFLLLSNNLQFDKFANSSLMTDTIEVIAPIGTRAVVQLSDGTIVNLNYGSRIKYPRTFTGSTREIKLSGEAYFDVAQNPDKPFIVQAGTLRIKALGTEFNLLAYPCDDIIATTLVEGKVIIEKKLSDVKTTQVGTMDPGQHIAYNYKTGEIKSNKVHIENYIAWKEGKLIFDNTPISEVAEKLSRIFNADILVDDDIKDLTYTVTFTDDPLFLILDLMAETTPVTYRKLPRKKQDDGTFSKQIIKIERRQ